MPMLPFFSPQTPIFRGGYKKVIMYFICFTPWGGQGRQEGSEWVVISKVNARQTLTLPRHNLIRQVWARCRIQPDDTRPSGYTFLINTTGRRMALWISNSCEYRATVNFFLNFHPVVVEHCGVAQRPPVPRRCTAAPSGQGTHLSVANAKVVPPTDQRETPPFQLCSNESGHAFQMWLIFFFLIWIWFWLSLCLHYFEAWLRQLSLGLTRFFGHWAWSRDSAFDSGYTNFHQVPHCVCLCVCASICIYLRLFALLCLSVSLCPSVSLCVSLCLCMSVCLRGSVSLSVIVSHCGSLCVSVCLCMCVLVRRLLKSRNLHLADGERLLP